MVFFQAPEISAQTFLKVFIVHGILFGSFLFIAYMILKRDRKWINIIASSFYISFATGLLLNFIFVLISFEPYGQIVLTLYYATMFFLMLGTFFLTIFSFILLQSESVFTKKKQLFLILICCIIVFCMVFIPNGVTINDSTDWNPVYSIGYFIYIFIVFTVFSVIPQIYCFIKIHGAFQNESLQKRWKFFIIGTTLLYIFCYGTIIYHTLDIQEIRTIWSLISLGLAVASAFLIFRGIGKIE